MKNFTHPFMDKLLGRMYNTCTFWELVNEKGVNYVGTMFEELSLLKSENDIPDKYKKDFKRFLEEMGDISDLYWYKDKKNDF